MNIVGMLVTIASCEFSNRIKGNNLFIDNRWISVTLPGYYGVSLYLLLFKNF